MCYWQNSLPEVNVGKSIWSWTKCGSWKRCLWGWQERCQAAVEYCCLTRGFSAREVAEVAWKVSAALWCSCAAEAAWSFFAWAWWDRPAAVGWGRPRLIFGLCIRSWFMHHFAAPSFPLPTCCTCSDPGRIALKQLIKDCSLNQSQIWLHLVQDKTVCSLS